MRAITVKQPWATAIAACSARGPELTAEPKRVENRSRPHPWRSAVGERIAIHAGMGWDKTALGFPPFLALADGSRGGIGPMIGWFIRDFHQRGVVLATALLTDVHQCDGSCSPWAIPDQWHLVLADVYLLPELIPARGALGLWTVPEDVAA